jgi:hypothetical protein
MYKHALLIAVIGLSQIISGCAMHSTSKNWSDLSGVDDPHRYYRTTTRVGLNLLVGIPVLGNTNIDKMVADLTESIAAEDGSRVRIVDCKRENYWYGFTPVTWIFTPIKYIVAAEYTPDEKRYIEDQEQIRARKAVE